MAIIRKEPLRGEPHKGDLVPFELYLVTARKLGVSFPIGYLEWVEEAFHKEKIPFRLLNGKVGSARVPRKELTVWIRYCGRRKMTRVIREIRNQPRG